MPKPMKKKKIKVTEQQRQTLIVVARETAHQNLQVCDEMLKSNIFQPISTPTFRICLALYTFALEEYGKILWLGSLPVQNSRISINRDTFESHDNKFKMALSSRQLPAACKNIHTSFIGTGGKPIAKKTVPDLDTRMKILYSNVDDNGNPERYPKINKKKLQRAILNLTNELLNF